MDLKFYITKLISTAQLMSKISKKFLRIKILKFFLLVNYFGLNAASNLEIAKKLKNLNLK